MVSRRMRLLLGQGDQSTDAGGVACGHRVLPRAEYIVSRSVELGDRSDARLVVRTNDQLVRPELTVARGRRSEWDSAVEGDTFMARRWWTDGFDE